MSTELALLLEKVEALGECETVETVDYIAATLAANLDKIRGRHSSAISAMFLNSWPGFVGDAEELLVPISDAAWPAVDVLQAIDELLTDLNGCRGETGVAAIRHRTLIDLRDCADAVQSNVADLFEAIDKAARADQVAS